MDFQEGEILLVDKPLTWTSFNVVNKIRYEIKRQLKIKKIKVGHAGTLDPLATGLLVICTGKKTKTINDFLIDDKEYTGIITLGATTPSFDLETEIDHVFDTNLITEEAVFDVAKSFLGEQLQTPPIFSAKKIDGEKAYDKARRGEDVVMKKSLITIHEFDIDKIDNNEVHFRIRCSKGTYIRSIAFDFGRKLNNGGHLTKLVRTKSGTFDLNDAYNLDDLLEVIKTTETIQIT
jgi:tRNA pseudouridine55 synthase